MSDLSQVFGMKLDGSDVDESSSFDCLPPCEPICLIEAASIKDTKNGFGKFLEIQMQIIQPPFKGRKLWDRFMLVNNNPQVDQQKRDKSIAINKKRLDDLRKACDIANLMDECELLNKVVSPKVAVKKDQNEIRTYKNPGTLNITDTQPKIQPKSTQSLTATPGVPPWLRK
jgi:hypothetical protein